MSNYLIQSETLSGIANAIRGKTGGSTEIPVEDFATEINGIQTGHTTTIDGVEVDRDLDLDSTSIVVPNLSASEIAVRNINNQQCIKYVNFDKSHLLAPDVTQTGTNLILNVQKSDATSWNTFLTNYIIDDNIDAEHFEGVFKANLYKVDGRYLFLIGYNGDSGKIMKLIDITNTSNPSVVYSTEESGDEMLGEVIELDNGGILILNNDGDIHTIDINYVNSNWSIGSDLNSGINFDAESIDCFSGACIGKNGNSYHLIFCCDQPTNEKRYFETFEYTPSSGLVDIDVKGLDYIEINGTKQKGSYPIYCGKDDDNNCYFIGYYYNRIKVTLKSDFSILDMSYVSNNANPSVTLLYGDYNNGYHDCGCSLRSTTTREFYNFTKMRSPLNEGQSFATKYKFTYYSEV
jgi:hypothetical protein